MASATSKLVGVFVVGLLLGAVPIYFLSPTGAPVTTTFTATTTVTSATKATSALNGTNIVVGVYGGSIGQFFQKSNLLNEFKKTFGVTVTLAFDTSANFRSKIEIQKSNPPYDVVLLDSTDVIRLRAENLTVPLSASNVPNLATVDPRLVIAGSSVALLPYWVGIGYNTQKVTASQAPTSWADLWNPQWKGQIGITPPSAAFGYVLLIKAAELNGGSINNISPGYQKIGQLKPNVATVSNSVFPLFNSLVQGQISITPMDYSSYVSTKLTGAPIAWVFPKDGTFLSQSDFAVVANRPSASTQAALAFINYVLNPIIQGQWASWTYYPPANQQTVLPPSVVGQGINSFPGNLTGLQTLDYSLVVKNQASWTANFTAIYG